METHASRRIADCWYSGQSVVLLAYRWPALIARIATSAKGCWSGPAELKRELTAALHYYGLTLFLSLLMTGDHVGKLPVLPTSKLRPGG